MPPPKVTRAQLTVVVFNLFREFGYHATSIQDIADEAGIGKATFYYHFKSKEEILIAAITYATEQWDEKEEEEWEVWSKFLHFLIKMKFEMENNVAVNEVIEEIFNQREERFEDCLRDHIMLRIRGEE